MPRYLGLILLSAAFALAGCKSKAFTEPVKLHDKVDKDGNAIAGSGDVLDPHVLTNGYEAYMR